ncbi:UDP-N-acetylmuramoyl-tripeptide--D-alanyl-D-alanine ligase [Paenibacillus baekrokdamisoli]|uniref:UDP-N-acetylmuramoyl-tripeptide--D-alanyl-D-alanine ligase n=1 Tax=Paenibacillus baekrokdamisoli TaxID=1712516 RepID=A0A3G9JH36_9BACL|nr:UDP-N-acetylmuramoyl-tripeptide--D-alanyl-D-alanine ligase [Paenibacillus baekrokdamisoli]BBH24263.1 UDP-N-acetylmuramoyl-tripeptide--D-alanyl-D-alanine ligase [Paenibacillus baekrokdamisoli]
MICHKLKVIEHMAEGSGLSVLHEDLSIQGVSIDSRTIKTGNLFVPIIRRLDGHDYVEEAIAKGATASLWQKDHPNPPIHFPLIYVDDCLIALQTLATNYRIELPIKVIGVTGSNGKTTTKDMINSVLGTTYRVHKTKGNLNSQIGVPLTILEVDKSTDVAVIEMGMSERGQIDRLSRIAQPDIAVITMIGVSHLSSLGSREEIATAKLEIVNGMQDDGKLIYNGDEPLLINGLKGINITKTISVISFGESKSNDYNVASIETNSEGSFFTVGDDKFYIPLLGSHNISNALATVAVASNLGIGPAKVDEGFRSLKITSMRMEKIISPSGLTIINDAWNASPISMTAAIKTFEELTGFSRKYLVLGDMLELGEQELEFHRDIGRNIDPSKIDYVYTVGTLGRHIALQAEKRFPNGSVQAFLDKEELMKELKNKLMQNDAILLKGSRGMQLETILPILFTMEMT